MSLSALELRLETMMMEQRISFCFDGLDTGIDGEKGPCGEILVWAESSGADRGGEYAEVLEALCNLPQSA